MSTSAPATAPESAADPTAVYAARLHRAQAALHAHGLDYLFVGPSADLFYLTGLDLHVSERLTLLMVHQEGPSYLVLPNFEAGGVGPLPTAIHLAPWHEHEDPV